MSHVALFRNLNQGQSGSPTRDALAAAFATEGAGDVRFVRGNGTVVFDGDASLANAVATRLAATSPWHDVVQVRSLDWVRELVDSNAEQSRVEVTFFDESLSVAPPLEARRCRLLEGGAGFAVVLNLVDRVSDGTPLIEKALGVRATSRGVGTLQLL